MSPTLVTRANRQPIKCDQTGETWPSQGAWCRATGFSATTLTRHLTGKLDDIDGYTFSKVAEHVPEPHQDVYGTDIEVGTRLIIAVGGKGSGAIVTVLALTYWNNKPSLQVQWHNGKIGYWRDLSNTTLVATPTFGDAQESEAY